MNNGRSVPVVGERESGLVFMADAKVSSESDGTSSDISGILSKNFSIWNLGSQGFNVADYLGMYRL